MSYDQEDLQTLMRLGLNNSQAKVYLIMTNVRATKAKAIWKLSKVGRQDIYRILQELQKTGLIEKIVASPTEYRALPLAEGVSILFQRKKSEIAKLQIEATKLVETRGPNLQTVFSDQYQCIMIPEKEAFHLRASQSIERVQKNYDVSSTLKRISSSSPQYFSKAVEKGVQVRVIVNTEDKDCFEKLEQPFWKEPNFELRRIPHSPDSAFAILDKSELWIATITEVGLSEAPYLWSTFPSLVNLAQNYFETQWNMAEENTKCKRNRSNK